VKEQMKTKNKNKKKVLKKDDQVVMTKKKKEKKDGILCHEGWGWKYSVR